MLCDNGLLKVKVTPLTPLTLMVITSYRRRFFLFSADFAGMGCYKVIKAQLLYCLVPRPNELRDYNYYEIINNLNRFVYSLELRYRIKGLSQHTYNLFDNLFSL